MAWNEKAIELLGEEITDILDNNDISVYRAKKQTAVLKSDWNFILTQERILLLTLIVTVLTALQRRSLNMQGTLTQRNTLKCGLRQEVL